MPFDLQVQTGQSRFGLKVRAFCTGVFAMIGSYVLAKDPVDLQALVDAINANTAAMQESTAFWSSVYDFLFGLNPAMFVLGLSSGLMAWIIGRVYKNISSVIHLGRH